MLTAALIVFGVFGFFSVGLPFLALGFTLAVLSGARRLPHVFWPPIVGVILFFVTYVLLAPLGCRTSATEAEVVGPGNVEVTPTFNQQRITCDRLVLPDTVGTENPPLWPAALAAVAAAFGGANLARLAILRRPTAEPGLRERRKPSS